MEYMDEYYEIEYKYVKKLIIHNCPWNKVMGNVIK